MTRSNLSRPTSGENSAETRIRDNLNEATLLHNVQQSKATNWLAMMTSFVTGREARNQQRNREAEDACVRRTLWDEPSHGQGDETDDHMAKYVMGDNTETVHHHHHPKPALGTLAKAGVAAALIGSGVGAGAAVPLLLDLLKPGSSPTEIIDYDVRTRLIPPE